MLESAGLRREQVLTAEGLFRTFCYKYRTGGLIFRTLNRSAFGRWLMGRIDAAAVRVFGPAQLIVIAQKTN